VGGRRLRFERMHRLTRPQEFSAVMRSPCRSRDACFNVYAAANALAHARLGVTVSRRVSPKAVERNRIKRQIRESFRRHRDALAGLSLVVVAQAPAAGSAGEQLQRSLATHWETISTRCARS
jgi:ribonuclease P protein component